MGVRIIEHVFRSYQYVLHPTARQRRALEHMLAVQCEAYNAGLEERREASKRGIHVHRFDQFAQLKAPPRIKARLHAIRGDGGTGR